ncbi:hypothetical protein KAFR_0G02390 [Kazachstania africana CBS 2517]|uniref:Uncharacterized protein n=1 Tax=Kazachstania africana (strain ATCC 22294 / BCRC 22015 / CBS 2517 / CECT 1963 / NBRC 1671 / NRRL Y-8276) TaxID=1071382 RepID=H2AY23_KAZAF|nr:hypothetical protein KAFR_0G02390 [Kazachstania africana CBS 2517]CCF59273.1 hypothetical protein KAFR_0G02390 [Kazachstania africana CBS 2517]
MLFTRTLVRSSTTVLRKFGTTPGPRNLVKDLYLKELGSMNVTHINSALSSNPALKENIIDWTPPSKPKMPSTELGSTSIDDYVNQSVETMEPQTNEEVKEDFEEDWLVIENTVDDTQAAH